LLGARAALDYEPFLQGSKRIVASPGRLKDSHENFLFGMWIKAPILPVPVIPHRSSDGWHSENAFGSPPALHVHARMTA
jgi:hypothetical protein